ncbi:MAG: indole-3-glycerol phosphate synthase TrpC [Anaerolineales bacterium]
MILDELVASARAALPARQAKAPLAMLKERVAALPAPADLAQALAAPGVGIIAEVKRASPSRGALNTALDPAAWAANYVRAGAIAISVLTEPTRFLGSLDDLAAARRAVDGVRPGVPLLRKDFIVDPYQVYEARAFGADAVLLIVAALDDSALAELYHLARDLGLTPLVEVHNEIEMARAARLAPSLVGINNRNLATFAVDLNTTLRLLPSVPEGALVVAESGIHTPKQVHTLAEHGVHGVLIGEALVTAPDPVARLSELLAAGR